jgi:CHAD domain-containing protein
MSEPTTRQFAAQQGDRLLRRAVTQVARTIRSRGVNEVHDLRVAIRHYMRVLIVLKPCFPRAESRRIRRSLKRIMVQAGFVRDHDIAIGVLGKMAVPQPGTATMADRGQKGNVPVSIAQQLAARREEAAGILLGSLERWVERNLPSTWRRALKAHADHTRFGDTPAFQTASRILPEMATEHFRCGADAAHDHASVEEIHRFRIAARNLRYTLDLFGPLYGTSLAGLLEQLRDVQALLGDLNDCATVRRILHRLKASKQEGGKEILAALRKRQRRKTEQFRAHYAAEFANAAILRLWKATLRNTGGPVRARKRPAVKRAPAV